MTDEMPAEGTENVEDAQRADKSQTSNTQTGPSRKGKLVFVAIFVAVALFVYVKQKSGGELPNWPSDLPAAIKTATERDKPILVFVALTSPSQVSRNMAKSTIRGNLKFMNRYQMLRVLKKVEPDSEFAKEHSIKKFPTFLLLDKTGKELGRVEGLIGEMNFYREFLAKHLGDIPSSSTKKK